MDLLCTDLAWDDYLFWQKSDKVMLKRINEFIKIIKRTSYEGIGKPEPLKFELTGKWSRRINDVHRIVYEINNARLVIYQCRYHY